jgi:hypothetical protein
MDALENTIERLRHPAPGSRIEAARDFGIDLNLLIANLRLTPAERVSRMHEACVAAEEIRGIARGRTPERPAGPAGAREHSEPASD